MSSFFIFLLLFSSVHIIPNERTLLEYKIVTLHPKWPCYTANMLSRARFPELPYHNDTGNMVASAVMLTVGAIVALGLSGDDDQRETSSVQSTVIPFAQYQRVNCFAPVDEPLTAEPVPLEPQHAADRQTVEAIVTAKQNIQAYGDISVANAGCNAAARFGQLRTKDLLDMNIVLVRTQTEGSDPRFAWGVTDFVAHSVQRGAPVSRIILGRAVLGQLPG
jgi:hypothetical protein